MDASFVVPALAGKKPPKVGTPCGLRRIAAVLVSALICSVHAASIDDLPDIQVKKGDWPWWRGPTSDNKSSETNPPLRWSTEANVLWKSPVPGKGHASPAIVGNRVFIPSADEAEEKLWMLCYARDSGELIWQTEIHHGGFLMKHDKNSHASASPACDGELVFFPALFDGELWVTAVEVTGKIRWKTSVGKFTPSNGFGSSPVLYKSAVIVAADNVGDSSVTALHRKTGAVLWKTERPKLDNFCTPVLGRVANKMQLLLCGSKMIASYDPANGNLNWFVQSSTEVTACTMAFDDRFVVGGGNVPVREFMCVRGDGSGDVTASHVQWRSRKHVTYVPSPLLYQKLLYFVSDNGIAHCIDIETGEEFYKERLEGDFTASPLMVDGKIFATNENGKTFIFNTGITFEVIGANELNEATLASPVLARGNWFIRTASKLICVGEPMN